MTDQNLSILKQSSYLFITMIAIGILFIVQHYPYGQLIGFFGLLGLIPSKYIPFYIDFNKKKWKLSLLNYATFALWLWFSISTFILLDLRIREPQSCFDIPDSDRYLNTSAEALLVITIALFTTFGFKWLCYRFKNF